MKYKMVVNHSNTALEEEINQLLYEGWKPSGSAGHTGGSGFGCFFQAMTYGEYQPVEIQVAGLTCDDGVIEAMQRVTEKKR